MTSFSVILGRILHKTAVVILFALALSAWSQTAKPGFRIVGYMPSWQGDIAAIQYSKLTHVIMAFALPQDNGGISNIPTAKLNQMVPLAHAAGVKVFLALGGGSNQDNGWVAATGSETARIALADACMKAVRDFNLDGIDFDWEYPDGTAQVTGFNAAVKLLAGRLHAEGKEISAAVTLNDWPRSFPNNELFPYFDFLNIMVYDNPAPHATMDHARTAVNVWITTKGLPKDKFVLGCPFYNSAGQMYRNIVAANPAAAYLDLDGREDHNSIPTIRKKTQLALEQGGGVMFWELSHDATGTLSLLSAAYETARTGTPLRRMPATKIGAPPTLFFRDGPLVLTGIADNGITDLAGRIWPGVATPHLP